MSLTAKARRVYEFCRDVNLPLTIDNLLAFFPTTSEENRLLIRVGKLQKLQAAQVASRQSITKDSVYKSHGQYLPIERIVRLYGRSEAYRIAQSNMNKADGLIASANAIVQVADDIDPDIRLEA